MAEQKESELPSGRAVLHIEGVETEGHSVPTDVLLTVLTAMEQTAFVVGASREKREVRQRFKPDASLRERYTLRVRLPEQGSYAIPFEYAIPELPSVETDGVPADFLTHCVDVMRAVSTGARDQLSKLIPDSRLRDRAVRAVRDLAPPPGRGYVVGVHSAGRSVFVLNAQSRERADELIAAPLANEAALTTVTGEVIRMDFAQRVMTLLYAPTSRILSVNYEPEEEEDILRWRDAGALQVTGVFELDDESRPTGLLERVSIQQLDLSPIVLSTFDWGGRRFEFDRPLSITPQRDEESGQLLVAEEAQFGLHSFAYTREQLVKELEEEIAFCFDAYASAPDEQLDSEARLLAAAYRAHVRMEVL